MTIHVFAFLKLPFSCAQTAIWKVGLEASSTNVNTSAW